ncbi:queuosine-tRNA galactosyltransferase-like, partial [Oncorhynchus masou masou]|uniref:queuosine-tRNA galactosyltransferase-like n=1 Tax=Oncorhynchus masou masou TaxID=90313 RepID=UPI003183766A
GVPEDLLWFYQSVGQGGGVVRVDQCLLVYRYHQQAATHSVLEETIWNLRVAFLQERVINQWESFTIWNAGKQGRKLYRCLSSFSQKKVRAFCDVDVNKIKKGFYTYEESKERPKPQIPVLHYRDASPPYIICVKLDMTGGVFEENLKSLHLEEGAGLTTSTNTLRCRDDGMERQKMVIECLRVDAEKDRWTMTVIWCGTWSDHAVAEERLVNHAVAKFSALGSGCVSLSGRLDAVHQRPVQLERK